MTNKKALLSLMAECESLKKQMSASVLELNFCIECLMDDQDVRGKMKRELFEQLSSQLLAAVEKTLCKILEETSLKPEDIHSVQIVGGSCRIPSVKRLVQKVFGREPSATLNMDEAVARGCALQCALLSPTLRTKNFIIEDIQPYSIKIGWKMSKIVEPAQLFPRFHKVPSSKIITFSTSKPFSLQVAYENVLSLPDIAEFSCENLPPETLDKDVEIAIKAAVNMHGIFAVTSAEAILKHEEAEDVALGEEDNSTENTMDSEAKDDSNTGEKEVLSKPRRKIVKTSFRLDISPKFPSVCCVDLGKLTAKEKQMIQRDMNEKEKADARNTLEEYILELRAKLSDELKEFVTDEENEVLEKSFNDAEAWLYDDEDRKSKECFEKLVALKRICDPALRRFEEWEKKQTIIKEFQRILQEAFDAISSASKEMEGIKADEVQTVQCLWKRTQEYLQDCMNTFSEHQKNEACPITAAMVENEMKMFKEQYLVQLHNLKAILAKSDEDSGDNKKEVEEMNAKISETTSKIEIADLEDQSPNTTKN
ncbi:heat shock 70 kDa protein 4-like [Uloborus diversus]|uniref:heat shock 70 kDa protein 4-like n=1 Tax=Uloborus diversus TaxID=327109 RepID=UPI0024091E1B|nr:heat shock 70 kDa protein 4-like [Uloborus diversus]